MADVQTITKQQFLDLYANGNISEVVAIGTTIYGKVAARLHNTYKPVVSALVA